MSTNVVNLTTLHAVSIELAYHISTLYACVCYTVHVLHMMYFTCSCGLCQQFCGLIIIHLSLSCVARCELLKEL